MPTTPSRTPVPPLLPNEMARSWDGRVEIRPEPLRLRWNLAELASADGHRLKCSFACSIRALPDAAERKLLGEVFLGRRVSATADHIVAHFSPALQADAANIAASKKVAEWLADGMKDTLAESLHKAADKVAFSCGLEILPPFQVDLESPSFQQQKIEAMERNLAEQRVAGQVEHLSKAATLLKQFDALRQSAPNLSPGEVLSQISPADQGTMLQTLLLGAGKQSGGQTPWAVAGPYLVKIDPRVSPPKMELITLPATLGPLRSVQSAEIEGQQVLLVGARSGVMVVRADMTAEPQLFTDPDIASPMGFSRAIVWRGGLWGCHGDAGIVQWDLEVSQAPKAVYRPAHIPTASLPAVGTAVSAEVMKSGGVRNLAVIDDSRLIFSIAERLLTLSPEGQITALPIESSADIVAVLPDRQNVYVIHEDGNICTRDRATLMTSGEERRGGRILAASVLPWLGSVRLLLATDEGPIQCLGTDDQLVTQYLSPHRGLRMVGAAADLVLAVSGDRQRLVFWNSWDGRKPVAEVSVASIAKHRVADVEFA